MLAREILQRVREIQVRTGRQVADVLAGEYTSVFKGRGMEFDEVRQYVPGDDIRSIDWNVRQSVSWRISSTSERARSRGRRFSSSEARRRSSYLLTRSSNAVRSPARAFSTQL